MLQNKELNSKLNEERKIKTELLIKQAADELIIETKANSKPVSEIKEFKLVSKAQWSFESDNGMVNYDAESNDIIENAKTNGLDKAEIDVNDYEYVINFGRMIQVNTKTGKERKIERNLISCPSEDEFAVDELDTSSEEYKNISYNFLNEVNYDEDKYEVTKIERFDNPAAKYLYNAKKALMGNKQEMELYHGTHDNDYMHVAKQGLDFRLAKRTDLYLGRGIYGAKDPLYCVNGGYSHTIPNSTTKVLLLVNFLIGECYSTTERRVDLVRPPLLPGRTIELYDSTHTIIQSRFSDNVYCVYNNAQCYIKYDIHYKDV